MPKTPAPKPPKPAQQSRIKTISVGRRDIRTLKLADCEIVPGFNPRDAISESRIREMMEQLRGAAGDDLESNGQKEPARGHLAPGGKFLLTTGNTRFLALHRLAAAEKRFGVIHVISEPPGYTDLEREIDHITSNDGAPLALHEQGRVYQRLRDDHKLTVKKIHQRTGKTEQHIYDCLSLVNAPAEVLEAIRKNQIAPSTVVKIAKDQKPENVASAVAAAITTAGAAGKARATSKHVTTAPTKTKRKSKAKKADLDAALADLNKRTTAERMERVESYQADSVGRLQDLLNATVPSRCVTDRRETVAWSIDYLKGTKPLPELIAFLQGDR